MELSSESKQFLENVREVVKQIPPKPKIKTYEFKYKKQAKEELKEIIKTAIKNGKARVTAQRVTYYHEGDGYNAGERKTDHVYLICEETPYGRSMGFSLEPLFYRKIVTKPEQLTDEDIEELVEKLDIDFELEYGFAPKHPFRLKYKKLKEQEQKEYEKFKEQERLKIKIWEQENKEKLKEIIKLYNNLSKEAKNELRYLIDPYNGLFGFDPTIEHLIELAKQL